MGQQCMVSMSSGAEITALSYKRRFVRFESVVVEEGGAERFVRFESMVVEEGG